MIIKLATCREGSESERTGIFQRPKALALRTGKSCQDPQSQMASIRPDLQKENETHALNRVAYQSCRIFSQTCGKRTRLLQQSRICKDFLSCVYATLQEQGLTASAARTCQAIFAVFHAIAVEDHSPISTFKNVQGSLGYCFKAFCQKQIQLPQHARTQSFP